MTTKARLWTGVTVLLIIAFNYTLIGFPLYRRAASIQDKSRTIILNQVKSGKVLGSEDEYIIEILKKEKRSIDKEVVVLNSAAISLAIVAISWTVFGLIFRKRK